MTAAQASAPAPDPFDWYVNALAGDVRPLDPAVAPCGYFRMRGRNGGLEPLAVWIDDAGEKWAKRGAAPEVHVSAPGEVVFGDFTVGGEEGFCREVMAYAVANPIDVDLYFAVMEGGTWPDMPPELPVSFSNAPTDPHEALQAEIDAERLELERWLKTPIADQTAFDLASNWADRLARLEKRADALRVEAKKPHDEAAKAAQAKWKPLVDAAASLKARVKDATLPFQREQRAREAEARAEALRAGAPMTEARPAPSTGAARRVTTRTTYRAEIEDFPAALAVFAKTPHPDLVELIQRLANKVAANGTAIDGCKLITIQSAA